MTSYAPQMEVLSALGDRNSFSDLSKTDLASARYPSSPSIPVHAVIAATFRWSASTARLKHLPAAAWCPSRASRTLHACQRRTQRQPPLWPPPGWLQAQIPCWKTSRSILAVL